ncbi:sensor histidine kinase [Endothiovibrio diazotrophicus]
MRLGNKLTVAFGLLFLVTLVMVALLFWSLDEVGRLHRREETIQADALLLRQLDGVVCRQIKEVADVLLMGDVQLGELSRYEREAAELFGRWRELVASEADWGGALPEHETSAFDHLHPIYLELRRAVEGIVELHRRGQREEALRRYVEVLEELFEGRFVGAIDAVIAADVATVEASHRERQRHYLSIVSATVGLGGAAALFTLLLPFYLRRTLVRPLRELAVAAREVGQGRAMAPLQVSGRDEVAELAEAFARMEQDLRATTVSRDYFDSILYAMSDALVVVDLEGRIRTVNRMACSLLGYRREELVDAPLERLLGEGAVGEWRGWIAQWGLHGEERELLTRDGGRLPVLFSATPLYGGEREIVGLVMVAVDIRARKAAEARLRDSLAEKSVLLREIHHRVKNNMQVISSLLRMQARLLDDEAVREVLADIGGRVHSMALVHEKLYGTEDLKRVDFADYVRSLAEGIFGGFDARGRGLVARYDLEPLEFSIDTAVPCGLVLNELLSNALKYAYPEGGGEVRIALRRLDDGRCELRVADDGAGLPPAMDWRDAPSLGLHLVVNLVEHQLRGSVELEPPPGVAFCIRFEEVGGMEGRR